MSNIKKIMATAVLMLAISPLFCFDVLAASTQEIEAEAHIQKSAAYSAERKYAEAIAELNKAEAILPDSYRIYGLRGIALNRMKSYAAALSDFERAIKLNPSDFRAFVGRGDAYWKLGDYDKAIDSYDEAVRINPSTEETFFSRGFFYVASGKNYVKAIEDLKKAIELNTPDMDGAYFNIGRAYYELKDYDNAIKNFTVCLDGNLNSAYAPKNKRRSNLYACRANAYMGKKSYAEAIEDFKKSIELDMSYAANVYTGLAHAYYGQGNFKEALKTIEKAQSLGIPFPDDFVKEIKAKA